MERNSTIKSADLPNEETYVYRSYESPSSDRYLLMLHGNLSSSYCFESFFPALSEEFNIIAPDMRGFGYTSYNKEISTIDDLVEDIKMLVDELGLTKFCLFGWSVGAGVAVKFAARYPKVVEKLILQNCLGPQGFNIGSRQKCHVKPEDILKASKLCARGPTSSPRTRDYIKESMIGGFFIECNQLSSEKIEAYIDQMLMQRHLPTIMMAIAFYNVSKKHNGLMEGTGELEKIKCKTLVLSGLNDNFLNQDEVKMMRESLGEKASFKIFEKGGHCLMEQYPQETIENVLKFLSEE